MALGGRLSSAPRENLSPRHPCKTTRFRRAEDGYGTTRNEPRLTQGRAVVDPDTNDALWHLRGADVLGVLDWVKRSAVLRDAVDRLVWMLIGWKGWPRGESGGCFRY